MKLKNHNHTERARLYREYVCNCAERFVRHVRGVIRYLHTRFLEKDEIE